MSTASKEGDMLHVQNVKLKPLFYDFLMLYNNIMNYDLIVHNAGLRLGPKLVRRSR